MREKDKRLVITVALLSLYVYILLLLFRLM